MSKEEEQVLYYKPVFECILSSVESNGGDGSGLLYIRESFCTYEQVAEMFEDFLSEKGRQWKQREVEDGIIFYNDQEYIIICGTMFTHQNSYDILVETW